MQTYKATVEITAEYPIVAANLEAAKDIIDELVIDDCLDAGIDYLKIHIVNIEEIN